MIWNDPMIQRQIYSDWVSLWFISRNEMRGNVFSTFLIKRSNALLPLQDFNSKSNDWYKTASDWLLVQLKLIKIIVMNICIVHYDVNWYCRENSQWTDSLQRTYESFVHTDWFNHSIWHTFWTTYLIVSYLIDSK